MGAVFKVDFDTSELNKLVNGLAHFNANELLDNIGAMVTSQTEKRFEYRVDKDGKKWQSWSLKYKKSGKGIDILRNTQRLFGSINHQLSGNKVEVGSNVVYAGVHQYGSKAKNIPARGYLGISKSNEQEIDGLIKLYIKELMNVSE